MKIEHEVGRHLFEKWYGLLSDLLKTDENHKVFVAKLFPVASQNKSLEDKLKKAKEVYELFYFRFQGDLGHYFRTLYHVIKFVYSCQLLNDVDEKITIKNKRRYTSIVRAQLSQYELALLFYNGLSDYGNEKLKPLIERYGLLENFGTGDLVDQDHMNFYEKSAFEDLDAPKS